MKVKDAQVTNSLLFLVRDQSLAKHYRIRTTDIGEYFIARRAVFDTLPELVEHYQAVADGLCVRLTTACKEVRSSLLSFVLIVLFAPTGKVM